MTRLPAILVLVCGCGRLGFDAEPPEPIAVDLRAEWSTANSIAWTWTDPETLGLELGSLELAVAGSAAELARGDGAIYTAEVNPELGFLDDDSITDGLEPGTDYAARLRLLDRAGRVVAVSAEIAEATTSPAPTRELVMFADDPTAGYSIPAELIYTEGGAFAGTHCYSYVSVCDPGEALCFENLRRQGVDHDLSVIDAESWPGAYLELAVAAEGPDDSEYSQVRLMMRDRSSGETRVFTLESFTIRGDGRYRVFQAPLDKMFNSGEPLSPALAATHSVYEWGVGGSWTDGSTVRVDEVRVRY